MARLLTIPTGAVKLSLEQRRAPGEDDDIIPLDDAPTAEPVVDAGTGTGGDAALPENADALAAETSPEAPAAAEADPASDAAADSSVTDAPSAPAAGDDTTPPAAGDDAPAPDTGTADVPAEPTVDAPAETGTEGAPEPAAEPAGDIAPVPDDVAPAAPADTVNEPAAEASVTDAPAVDPAVDVPAAPAGEEQAAAVVDGASDAAAATDSPVDAGAEPVAPVEAAVDPVDAGFPEDVAPEADVSAPSDVASDAAPVEGTAPVAPEGDFSAGAEGGMDTAADLTDSTVPGDPGSDPVNDVAAPVDGATDPAAIEPAEPVDPMENVEPEEMTSAWVDGVAVDAEEVKQQLEDAANDVADADNVTEELEDAAVALEELAAKVSENLAEENPVVSDTTVNLVKVVADKTLHHIGEVLDLPASMESAATPHQRLMVTLESISEKAKQIWEAIKKALKAAWEAVVNFFKGLFDSAVRVKQAIGKVRAAVKSINADDKPNTAKIGNAAVVKGIAFAKFKGYSDLKTELTKFDGAMGPFLENSKGAIHNAIVASANEMAELAEAATVENHNQYMQILNGSATKAVIMYGELGQKLAASVSTGGETKKGGEGVTITTSGELPGGFQIQAMVPDLSAMGSNAGRENATDKFVEIVKGNSVSILHNPNSDADTIPVLFDDEMLEVLDLVEATIDSVLESKSTVSKFEQDLAKLQRDIDQKLVRADDNFFEQVATRMMIGVMTKIGPNLVKMNSQLMSMTVSIANNVVRYVTASAKEFPSFGNAPKGSVGSSSSAEKTETGTAVAVA